MKKRVSTKSTLLMASLSPTPQLNNNSPSSTILRNPTTATNKHSSPLITSLSQLRELSTSRLDDLKRRIIDRSHSEIMKDLEASHSRLHKRFKMEKQTCERVMDEADKDFKKMSERINQNSGAMKESYSEFIAEAEANSSRVCKSIIPEVYKSFEKAIAGLQTRYGISST